MDRVPNWAWWTIAGGILLSPVFAFLLAVIVEILIGALTQGGAPALLIVAAAAISGWLLLRKHRRRARAGNLLGDQA
jgi:integral membrane sensor domain MASE1